MNDNNKSESVMILPFKDAIRNYVFYPEDILKWIENEELKEDLDNCLDNLMIST